MGDGGREKRVAGQVSKGERGGVGPCEGGPKVG